MRTNRAANGVLVCALAAVGVVTVRAASLALGLTAVVLLGALLPAWLARRNQAERITSTDLILTRAIALFPIAIGVGRINSKASLLALIAIGVTVLPRIRFREKSSVGWRGAVIVGAICHSALIYRTEAPVQLVAAGVLVILLLAAWQSALSQASVLEAVMDSLAIYLVLSVVGYYGLGLRSPAAAGRLGGLNPSLGFFSFRVFFPFAGSMVTTPVLASAYLPWAISRAFTSSRRPKPLYLAGIVAGAFTLLAADYRVPIAIVVVLLVIASVRPKALRAAAVFVAIGLLCVPFWWNHGDNPVVAAAHAASGQAVGSVSRDGTRTDLDTLGNRTYLWRFAEEAYWRGPTSKKILGWGNNGQIKSGAAEGFYGVVEGFAASRYSVRAHSTAWQTLLDAGILGLLLVVAVGVVGLRAAKDWSRSGTRWDLLLSPVLPILALIATSGTEVTLAPGVGSEAFFVYMLLIGIAVKRQTAAYSGALETQQHLYRHGRAA